MPGGRVSYTPMWRKLKLVASRLTRGCGPVLIAMAAFGPARAAAQNAPGAAESVGSGARLPPFIGSDAEDRARLEQLLGGESATGYVARSFSSRLRLASAPLTFVRGVVLPEIDLVINSEIPFSQNDGAMWAGRGLSYLVRGGATITRGRWRLVVVPELVGSTNAGFRDVEEAFYRPLIDTSRYSRYSSPWMQHPFPMDQPVRFGVGAVARLDPGQSALWYEGKHAAAGVSTENEWWGPGVHDALILTNNAGGFPHAFVRTARPMQTRAGAFEGRWIVGALTESGFFDFNADNNMRTLAAASAMYRPSWEPELTLGVSRAVFAASSSGAKALLRWFDVVQPTTRPNARPWADSTFTGGRDQLTSVFARWVFPSAGSEVYGELGRAEWPASLRDFLVDPTHTMGYVIGGQWARPWRRRGAVWRFQAELTSLERSTSFRYRPTQSWYTSRAAPQGYTQRGQVLGASIGPGSSHQWIGIDLVSPTWRVGAFAGRWRLNVDHNTEIVHYERYPGKGWCEYDVNLYPGIRAGYQGGGIGAVNGELILGNRMNYLYQNEGGCPRNDNMRDVRNATIRLSITPPRPR
jgi:hypothetical protein